MYFIVNSLAKHITIGDLSLTLGPKQAIDLDKYIGRAKAEASDHLKQCIKARKIEVRAKTPSKSESREKEQIVIQQPVIDIEKITKDIVDQLKNNIPQPQQVNNNSPEILDAINKLTNMMSQNGNSQTSQASSDDNKDVSEDILQKIHKRAVEKISSGIKEKNIESENESVVESIDDAVSDLENLL